MLWIFLLLRRTYTSRTGVWPTECSYACGRCGAQCAARVFAEGFGTFTSRSGADAWGPQRAYELARANYDAVVRSLFAQAACPQCGQFSVARVGIADHEGVQRAESEEGRFAWAGAIAAVFTLIAIGLGALDRSGYLALAIASIGLAIGLITLWVKTPRSANMRIMHPKNVAFWWNNMWISPDATYVVPRDAKTARTGTLTGLTVAGSTVLFLTSVVPLVMWGGSFDKLYVVNTETSAVEVRIDGKNVGEIAATTSETQDDASNKSFELRPGDHVVEVLSADGKLIEKRDVPVERFDNDWIFAPHGRVNGACLGTIVTTYKKYGEADGPVYDIRDDALIEQHFDDAFRSSPSSVTLDKNTSETTRTAIRVFACRGGHTKVPFSSGLLRNGKSRTESDD